MRGFGRSTGPATARRHRGSRRHDRAGRAELAPAAGPDRAPRADASPTVTCGPGGAFFTGEDRRRLARRAGLSGALIRAFPHSGRNERARGWLQLKGARVPPPQWKGIAALVLRDRREKGPTGRISALAIPSPRQRLNKFLVIWRLRN